MDTEQDHQEITSLRQAALAELDRRRRVAWRVFSWSSLALIAVALGVTVWFGRPGARFPFRPYGLLTLVGLVLLSAGACLLIDQNHNMAVKARRAIFNHDRNLGAQTNDDEVAIAGGYVKMVTFLAAAAILAVLVAVDY